ncbi:MAG: chromosome segregation protein SMC [Candidatus Altiarchaeota archaeon]|nr:chromosome segregation protein SMC [Candidatus Altiarchaeota archaeon]
MHLDRLELRGFKSFRDKTVLEFPDQFTAVVGPNGSGKSNIVDSICFVLGKSRGLRANNLSELVYNGGIGGKGSEYAKVSMYLSNGTKNQVKISREIDGGGKSIYRLDSKRSSRQEIMDIIGDNEYNIILQDDVTRVIDMRPKERRQIIDGLCGIAEYDEKKEKALHELEKVEARISETHLILGEKQGYLGELGRERDEAIKYQSLQDELKGCRASILHLEIKDHEKKRERLDKKIEELRVKKQQNSDRVDEIKREISERNNKLKGINSEIIRLEEEKGSGRLVELRGEITRNQDKLENLCGNLKGLESDLAVKKVKRQTLLGEEKKLGFKLKNIIEKIPPLSEKIKVESKKVGSLKIDKDIDKLKTEIFDLRSRIDTNAELSERDNLEIKNLLDDKSSLKEEIKKSLGEETKLAREIDDHLIRNKSGFDEYDELKKEQPKLNQRLNDVQRELKEVQIKFAGKKSELKTLEKTSGGLNSSIVAVMNLKKIIPGIHGPVSQLGSISDSRYERALRVAAGGRMQNIVVENEDTAAKCIEYLRKKRIGRATFLPLTKINVKVGGKVPKGAIGFARDFITAPHKFEKIFAYVYGDTLLVENLDKAKKLGVGRWRMVTLDADLLSRAGAMTGGHLNEAGIKFSSTDELIEGIKHLEDRIVELDGGRQELELKREAMEERILELEDSVGEGKIFMEKIHLTKGVLGEKRKGLQQRVDELDARINNLKKKVSEINSSVKKMKQGLGVKETKLVKMLKKGSSVDSSVLEGLREDKYQLEVELNRLEEKKTLIHEQVNDLKEELLKLERNRVESNGGVSDVKKCISSLGKKLSILEKENIGLMNAIEELINGRAGTENEIEDFGNECGRLEFELGKVNEKVGRREIENARIETRLTDLKEEFTPYSGVELMLDKKLKELGVMVSGIEDQLQGFGSINMRAIEGYEVLKKEFEDVSGKLETLKSERQSVFDFMEMVEQKKRETFMNTFDVVKTNFERIFAEISGGEGTLILDNPREVSDSGLLITASPKGKKVMCLDAMSGGEKVLTSSAFLLAIQQYKPSYFYIVDELDAALDKENSAKLAGMLRNSGAQFMMVTHNDNMIKHAHSVIGVSMSEGISRVVGVKLT